jgi:hypothetical protein
MPCYYTGSAEGDRALSAQTTADALTEITDLLCKLCRSIDADKPMPKAVKKWWAAHKKVDEAREQRERLEAERLNRKELAEYARLKKKYEP